MPQLCAACSCAMNRPPPGTIRDQLPTELSTGLSTVISTALSTGTHAHGTPSTHTRGCPPGSPLDRPRQLRTTYVKPELETRLFGVDTHRVHR